MSSAARRSISTRCLKPWPKVRSGCAGPTGRSFTVSMASCCGWRRPSTLSEFKEFVEQNPIRPGRHSAAARAALERRTIHIPDVLADPEYTYGAKDFETVRTVLAVPILKGDDFSAS